MSLSKQLTHLKNDKVLKKIIDAVGNIKSTKNNDLYFLLLKAIVSQQLSIKAADTIWKRFLLLFKEGYPKAGLILELSSDQLRSVGLSYQKAEYMKNIANFSIRYGLDYKKLKSNTDDELIAYLIQIKGVGRWTVEMLLMFALNRPNVLPLDDLGIQNGIIDLYKLKFETKKDLFAKMTQVAESWKPYRTLACKYIWRYKDLKV